MSALLPPRVLSAPSAALRGFFRRYAAGVSIVTLPGAAGPVGFTASSLASVSLDPPLVSFNVSRTASSWPALQDARHVGVHLLGERDRSTATVFATSGADRFAGVEWREGDHGVPLLRTSGGWLLGRVVERVAAGDSTLVIAEVLDAALADGLDDGHEPLVWHGGAFRRAV
ncbi:flavin reductase (DIM6/NTAB) family NADH-FMN oxidoreductase RutF [Motilibacter rhizosphaerae]|uniref:Flavin reductase (DIM6/NTAB) family NADH-FMN oxidoreductase RutF n=1 Tax=Motilibacter rhizosphaerae TaxID=598652 RepID=A0A4Q7NG62_9ACTN|nr:flavin reductase family protein [Motilibacter rhizosphaerae]RZS82802.1 flavin reductase (DIM6/NTAB) family NADH-FMN oxidoreductase RutF [Motilibacter rhizosphaerae]